VPRLANGCDDSRVIAIGEHLAAPALLATACELTIEVLRGGDLKPCMPLLSETLFSASQIR